MFLVKNYEPMMQIHFCTGNTCFFLYLLFLLYVFLLYLFIRLLYIVHSIVILSCVIFGLNPEFFDTFNNDM